MSKKEETPTDQLHDSLRLILEKKKKRIDDHEVIRASEPYQAAIKQLDRLLMDYVKAVTAINLMATRHPPLFDQLIVLHINPHLIQSLLAAMSMAKDGMLDPARRELRFLLELSVKTFSLDKGGEQKDYPEDVTSKIALLNKLRQVKFKEIVTNLSFNILTDDDVVTYRQNTNDLYKKLSTQIHVSAENISRDFANFDRDKYFGFETIAEINSFYQVCRRVLDVALASHFEAFDAGLVGDILVNIFDEDHRWTFRKMPLVGAIDQHFDYKFERRIEHD